MKNQKESMQIETPHSSVGEATSVEAVGTLVLHALESLRSARGSDLRRGMEVK